MGSFRMVRLKMHILEVRLSSCRTRLLHEDLLFLIGVGAILLALVTSGRPRLEGQRLVETALRHTSVEIWYCV